MIAHNRIVDALQGAGYNTKSAHGYTMAQCPVHGDREPSLSIRQLGDRARIKCFAGCHDEDILDALQLAVKDLFDNPKGSTYKYVDARGNIERTVTRPADRKTFFQTGQRKSENGERVMTIPYRLPKIMKAISEGSTIYLVEGEADVEAAESVGMTATTYPGGNGMIGSADFTHLYGGHIIAVRDRDDAGMEWLETVRDALHGNVASISYQQPVEGCKDLSDHLVSGHSPYMLEAAPITEPAEPIDVPDGVDVKLYLAEMERQYTVTKARKAVQDKIKAEDKDALGYETTEEWEMNSVITYNANESVKPEAWARTDGEHLLYRNKSHALIADGGTGKTLIALDAARWFAERGEDVLFIDYEDTGNTAATRLRTLGTTEQAAKRIIYVSGSGHLNDKFQAVTRRRWGLVIIDSVDESLISVTGDTNSPSDNGAVKLWNHQFVFPFLSSGATVLMIDHMSKGKDTSKVHARGASAKKDILTGAQLFLDQINPIAPGKNGTLRARVAKDRPGGLKGFMDEAEAVADFNVKSAGVDSARIFIDPPKPPPPAEDKTETIKRTLVMQVEANPDLKATDYQKAVTGSTEDKRKAWAALIGDGCIHQDRTGNTVTWTVTDTGRTKYLS